MRKTILALAIPAATIMMASAHAANVYNANGSSLDVYGKVEADMTHAGSTGDSDAKGDLTTSARLGIKGETRVNDNVSVFAKGEWQVAGQNSDGSKFTTRKAYLGADFGKDGKVSFGQQNTPLYTSLTQAIDIFDQWGMEAQTGIYGESRQASQAIYSNTFGNLDVQAGYQFRNNDGKDIGAISKNTEQDNAYSLAGVYHIGTGLNLRAAYARQNFGNGITNTYAFNPATGGNTVTSVSTGNSDGKIDTYGLGADYTLNDLYLAFVYLGSKTDNGAAVNSNTSMNSYDLVGAYNINQYRLYTGYGLQKTNADGSSSQNSVKSYKLGLEYNITPNALTWVEYRHNNADGTYDGAAGYAKNEVALSGEYDF
ncbi:porin [Marinomonas flavescens]|uniref:porin n=1 Tax=Marinomonas flavescens TaxID=2529379 RepID=UPI001054E7D1|nr:porin [Marinomonas flavescens]